jgi:hypothetical protein
MAFAGLAYFIKPNGFCLPHPFQSKASANKPTAVTGSRWFSVAITKDFKCDGFEQREPSRSSAISGV